MIEISVQEALEMIARGKFKRDDRFSRDGVEIYVQDEGCVYTVIHIFEKDGYAETWSDYTEDEEEYYDRHGDGTGLLARRNGIHGPTIVTNSIKKNSDF